MSSPYLNQLIQIARVELPQLAHDAENASTIYTVQEIAKKLLNITMYLVHHVILTDPSVAGGAQAAAPPRAPAAPAAPTLPALPPGLRYARGADGRIYVEQVAAAQPATVGHPPAVDHFPSLAPAAQVPMMAAPAFGLPPLGTPTGNQQPSGQSPVAEVTITPQGSRVAVPGQPVMVLPPGVAADAAVMGHRPIGASGIPGTAPVFASAPGQPAEVVVSPVMSPEVAAALAGRSTEGPMMDASGGARNVTNE